VAGHGRDTVSRSHESEIVVVEKPITNRELPEWKNWSLQKETTFYPVTLENPAGCAADIPCRSRNPHCQPRQKPKGITADSVE